MEESNAAFEATNKLIEDQKQALERANDQVRHIGESFIEMALRGEASFKTMADSILNEFIRMESRILSSKLFGDQGGSGGLLGKLLGGAASFLGGLIGGGTGTGLPPAIIPGQASAMGNVFSGGKVVPFTHGGVVNSPTIFPMKDGIGLLGEAGPEAILPLKRGRGGKLGVVASAGQGAERSGGNVEVNIYAPPGSDVREERNTVGGTEQINVFIDNAVAQNMNRPGTATFRAMTTTHGTRQQLVQR